MSDQIRFKEEWDSTGTRYSVESVAPLSDADLKEIEARRQRLIDDLGSEGGKDIWRLLHQDAWVLISEVERLREALRGVLPPVTPFEAVQVTNDHRPSLCRFCKAEWPTHRDDCAYVKAREALGLDSKPA